MSTAWCDDCGGTASRLTSAAARREPIDHVGQRRVGEDVGVVRQEHRLVLDEMAHAAEPLADGRVEAGVDERDAPIGDVGA